MEFIIVEIKVPAIGQSFDARIPKEANCQLVSAALSEAAAAMSDGSYTASASSLLVFEKTGKVLDRRKTIGQCSVCEGDSLLII